MKRFPLLIATLLGFTLVACGGDDTSEPTLVPPSVSVSPTSATEAATTVPGTTPEPTTVAGETATAGTATPAPAEETAIPAASEPVTSTYYIPTSQLPLVRFHTSTGPVELRVEVPARSEYAIGLSGRTSLEGRGMVFYREDFGQTGFWMRNTHIDLDIAFVNADGEIVFITTMIADTEDIHRPDTPYVAAIEATAGWYAAHGVQEGDEVEYLFDLSAAVTD